jgi:PAS domain S-box-containing protein
MRGLLLNLRNINHVKKKNIDKMMEYIDFLTNILEDTSQPFASGHIDGRMLTCNDAFCKMLGYTKKELSNLKWTTDLTPQEWYPEQKQKLEILHKTKKPVKFEKEYFRKDGSRIPLELIVHLAYNEEKKPLFYYVFYTDLTERKKAEKALKDSKEQAELYLDLMGHDINNMNQIAIGYLELAREIMEINGYWKDDVKILVEKPIDTLKNSIKLIKNVMTIQNIKEGKYNLKDIDVVPVVRDSMVIYSKIPNRNIEISLRSSCEPRIKANELIKDVFENLIGNSIKHSTGSMKINIDIDKVNKNGQENCRIIIEDNGPGISDVHKPHVFERSYIEEPRHVKKGIGLYLVKKLIESYNGNITIEDRVKGDFSKGCRFIITIPSIV